MLSALPYVNVPGFPNEAKADAEALLLSNNRQKTFVHAKSVADTTIKIAQRYGLDKSICEICGFLHDISAVVKPDDMVKYAVENGWYIDNAERKYPFLLHQRISKVIAEQDFGVTDARVLSAIECHTTLKAAPSAYDMALFIADKLSWDQQGAPPFFNLVSDALEHSLESASLAYIDYIVENKMILLPHKWFEAGAEFLRGNLGRD